MTEPSDRVPVALSLFFERAWQYIKVLEADNADLRERMRHHDEFYKGNEHRLNGHGTAAYDEEDFF